MNNKFLFIIFFLQSYLFGADIPHERPTNEKEEQPRKKQKIESTSAVNFEKLTNLIQNGDTQKLKDILNSNNNEIIKAIDDKERNALHLAAEFGKVDVVKLLLDSPYVDYFLQPMKRGQTALHIAAKYGEVDIAKLLLDPPYVNYFLRPMERGQTALHIAAEFGHVDIAKLLLDSPYVNYFLQPMKEGWTALFVAAEQGQFGVAKLLLDSPYVKYFLQPMKDGWNALHVTAGNGYADIAKLFLESKYAEHFLKPSYNGWTVLHAIAKDGQVKVVKLLLKSRDFTFIYKMLSNNSDFFKNTKYIYIWQLIYKSLLKSAYKNVKTQDDILQAQKNAKMQTACLANGLDGTLKQKIFEENFLKKLYKDLMPLANASIINNATCFANPTYKMEIADCNFCYKENKQLYVCLAGNYACKNKLCIDCIKSNLDILCQNKTDLPICSKNECREEICPQILEVIGCDKDKVSKLKANIFFLHNSKNPLWRACPTTDCVGGLNLKGDDHYFACNICDFNGCLDCGEDHHGKCDIYRAR